MLASADYESYAPAADALKNRVILITGASGGLGSAIARGAAEAGATLVLLGRNRTALEQLYDELEQLAPGCASIYLMDIAGASVEDHATLIEKIVDTCGRLDALVHCAATLGRLGGLLHCEPSDWQACIATNLGGAMFLTRAALPALLESARTSELASAAIFSLDAKSQAYWGAYGISKAALTCAMQILADEYDHYLLPDNRRCLAINGVLPPPMRTPLRYRAYPAEDARALAEPAIIAKRYLYLLDPTTDQMHGQIL